MKITGLDKLTRQLDEASKAAGALDGDLATVNFDPNDPVSVQTAVRAMERAVDQKVSRWRGNPLVDDMANKTKAAMRDSINKRAREARNQH